MESASDPPGTHKVGEAQVKDSKITGVDVVKHDGHSKSESMDVKSCEEEQYRHREKLVCRRRRRTLLPTSLEPEVHVQTKKRQRETDEAEQVAFFETVSKELEGSSVYKEFLHSLSLCRLEIITSSQLEVIVSCVLHEHQKHFSNKEEPTLILDHLQTCTPSYRLYEDEPSEKASTSSKSHTDENSSGPYSTEGVLNHTCVVARTIGGESFALVESNKYEEVLFKCEDDQYELDMLIETTRSTAGRVAECIEMLKDPFLVNFNLNDHLTPVHLRCIERIYNPIYPTLIAHTRDNPAAAFPTILSRLEQRLYEWKTNRMSLNKLWSEIRANNHSKSLVYDCD